MKENILNKVDNNISNTNGTNTSTQAVENPRDGTRFELKFNIQILQSNFKDNDGVVSEHETAKCESDVEDDCKDSTDLK